MPIIEEKADYPLEQAIEDYALWNESINPHRAGIIFGRVRGRYYHQSPKMSSYLAIFEA